MSKGSSPTIDRAVQRLPTRFGFLLIDDFTLISMSSAIETLRMANRLSGEDIYTWKTVSESAMRLSSAAAGGWKSTLPSRSCAG
jgi:transcriptional regulator GlxA family with amidase domain